MKDGDVANEPSRLTGHSARRAPGRRAAGLPRSQIRISDAAHHRNFARRLRRHARSVLRGVAQGCVGAPPPSATDWRPREREGDTRRGDDIVGRPAPSRSAARDLRSWPGTSQGRGTARGRDRDRRFGRGSGGRPLLREIERRVGLVARGVDALSDVSVNSATTALSSPAREMPPEEFRRMTESDVPRVRERDARRIAADAASRPRRWSFRSAALGSALAYRSIPLQSAYCVAKRALAGLHLVALDPADPRAVEGARHDRSLAGHEHRAVQLYPGTHPIPGSSSQVAAEAIYYAAQA